MWEGKSIKNGTFKHQSLSWGPQKILHHRGRGRGSRLSICPTPPIFTNTESAMLSMVKVILTCKWEDKIGVSIKPQVMKLNLKTSKWYSLHRFAPKLSNIWERESSCWSLTYVTAIFVFLHLPVTGWKPVEEGTPAQKSRWTGDRALLSLEGSPRPRRTLPGRDFGFFIRLCHKLTRFFIPNLTSVEFYDSASGQWATLPDLQRGRRWDYLTLCR